MGAAVAVTSADFDQEVLKSDVPVLVDFWSVTCGPCRALAPVLDSIAEEFSGKAKIVKVDVMDNMDVAVRYDVSLMPTLAFFKNGERVGQIVGAKPRQTIVDALSEYI
jgi:thioredoxin